MDRHTQMGLYIVFGRRYALGTEKESLDCIWAIGKGKYPNGLISAGNVRLDTLIFKGENVTPPSVHPSITTEEPKNEGEELWYVWLILCIVVLGACGFLVGFFGWKKKKKKEETSGHLYANAKETEEENEMKKGEGGVVVEERDELLQIDGGKLIDNTRMERGHETIEVETAGE